MDDMVARCPDCGMEQADAFAHCFVCMAPSRWWCAACREWRAARGCPYCSGGLGVPAELALGPCAVGAPIAFRVRVRNTGRRLLGCTVTCPDPAVSITSARPAPGPDRTPDMSIDPLVVPVVGPRLLLGPRCAAEVHGRVTVPEGPPGRRTFRLVFQATVPTETLIVVEATAAEARL